MISRKQYLVLPKLVAITCLLIIIASATIIFSTTPTFKEYYSGHLSSLRTAIPAFVVATIFFVSAIFCFYVSLRRSERRIRREITDSIIPKFLDVSVEVKALAELGVSIWRLEHKLKQLLPNGSEDEQKTIAFSLQRLRRYLETHDIEVQEYTGKVFNEGLNVDLLSVIKETGRNCSIVKETVEPAVLLKGQLVRKAKIIVLEGE